jgi:D-cysteine desulfhydrase
VSDPLALTRKIRGVLAPRSLGGWPTPTELAPSLAELTGLAALWLKREDRSSQMYGGSKVRALEFLLSGGGPDTVYMTIGGTGSTHCLATAVHAAALSRRAVLVQFPQPWTETTRAVSAAVDRTGALVVRAADRISVPLAYARAWLAARQMGSVRWIPGGGAHPLGVVGHFLAGLELASQLPAPPDAIVVPLGSGGTAAGLSVAVAALGWATQVVAARVAPTIVANRWRVAALARATALWLARVDVAVAFPAKGSTLVLDALGPGYGHPTVKGEAARALAGAHGLVLEPTYGAKAFSVLRDLGGRGFRRIVFWHTFAVPVPPDMAGHAE